MIPHPDEIIKQKQQYAKSLEEQFVHGAKVLDRSFKRQAEILRAAGEQQKINFGIQVDQSMQQQEILLAQRHSDELLQLQMAARQQRTSLEQQANALVMEYQARKGQEDMAMQRYYMQKEKYDTQCSLLNYQEDSRRRALEANSPYVPAAPVAVAAPPCSPTRPARSRSADGNGANESADGGAPSQRRERRKACI